VVGAVAAVLAVLYRLRVRRLLDLERLRMRIASDLHDDLGSELSGISLASAALAEEEALDASARRQLADIRASSSQLLERLRDIVWLIDPGRDRVAPLVDRMRSVAQSLLGGVELEFTSDCAGADLALGMTQRRDLLLLYRELLTNAARHSQASRVGVRLDLAGGVLELEVRDDGVGFDPPRRGDGTGLASARRRADALRGELQIEGRALGGGTRVRLRMPLGRKRRARHSTRPNWRQEGD
jgi:signal transduction histidine kinase